jgi:Flp pilus assembly protein TadG
MITKKNERRCGVAATELAILLPLIALLFAIGVDWCRIFYHSVTVENCARNGAIWAVDPYSAIMSQYATITDAALADAGNLSPTPTVSSASGTDNGRNYVDCTVTYTFTTISDFSSVQTPFFSVPKSTTISRTVRVYQAPQTPG